MSTREPERVAAMNVALEHLAQAEDVIRIYLRDYFEGIDDDAEQIKLPNSHLMLANLAGLIGRAIGAIEQEKASG